MTIINPITLYETVHKGHAAMRGLRFFYSLWRYIWLEVIRKEEMIALSELSTLPNIGKVVEQQLSEVGIKSVEQLIKLGSKQAWIRIKMIDESACINKLYSLEGAIQGIRWHNLSEEIKSELKLFYDSF